MKVKIKELTQEQVNKICSNHGCSFCPLNISQSYKCKNDYLKKYGEEEIEVKEDDK